MQDEQRLIIAAAKLARTVPEEWKEFLSALAAFNETLRDNLVLSPPDTMQINQGKAQLLSQLCKKLINAPEAADKMTKKV